MAMADRTTLEVVRPTKAAKTPKKSSGNGERERAFEAFRRWGYLEAELDPLGIFKPVKCADLAEFTGAAAREARRIYCRSVGAEFMHLQDSPGRPWIGERWEAPAAEVDSAKILERLVRADLLERVLQARYLGTKRFSLEGVTALIPLLDSVLDTAGETGAVDSVIAMITAEPPR